MAKVYNWQLGRDMHYPYEERHPRRQFAAVFNINRCIACQTCTFACRSTWTHSRGQEHMWWNNVETKPYGGYPHNWDAKLLGLLDAADPGGAQWAPHGKGREAPYGEYEGRTVFEAAPDGEAALGYLPSDKEWIAPNLYEDTSTRFSGRGFVGLPEEGASLPEHKTWFFYLQRICNHCTYPACVAACPRKALYKRPEDGVVLLDQERCRGYRKCMAACPYKKPMHNTETRVTEKCIACYPRLEGRDPLTGGEPMETRCMAVCPGRIRLQGTVAVGADGRWAEEPANPLYYLVRVAKVALPLYPQFGTEPNVYYIPPRWVPRGYLRQMFGPGVDAAIDAYAAPSRELLAVLQLFRCSQSIVFGYKVEPGPKVFERTVGGRRLSVYNDTVIGYGRKGQELFRTTVEEPLHVRPKERTNSV